MQFLNKLEMYRHTIAIKKNNYCDHSFSHETVKSGFNYK